MKGQGLGKDPERKEQRGAGGLRGEGTFQRDTRMEARGKVLTLQRGLRMGSWGAPEAARKQRKEQQKEKTRDQKAGRSPPERESCRAERTRWKQVTTQTFWRTEGHSGRRAKAT